MFKPPASGELSRDKRLYAVDKLLRNLHDQHTNAAA